LVADGVAEVDEGGSDVHAVGGVDEVCGGSERFGFEGVGGRVADALGDDGFAGGGGEGEFDAEGAVGVRGGRAEDGDGVSGGDESEDVAACVEEFPGVAMVFGEAFAAFVGGGEALWEEGDGGDGGEVEYAGEVGRGLGGGRGGGSAEVEDDEVALDAEGAAGGVAVGEGVVEGCGIDDGVAGGEVDRFGEGGEAPEGGVFERRGVDFPGLDESVLVWAEVVPEERLERAAECDGGGARGVGEACGCGDGVEAGVAEDGGGVGGAEGEEELSEWLLGGVGGVACGVDGGAEGGGAGPAEASSVGEVDDEHVRQVSVRRCRGARVVRSRRTSVRVGGRRRRRAPVRLRVRRRVRAW